MLKGAFQITGRYSEASEVSQQFYRRVEELKHFPSKEFVSFAEFKSRPTFSIMEAQKVVDTLQTPTLKALARVLYGIALIDGCKSKEDQMGGLEIAVAAGEEVNKIWGEENGKLIASTLVLVGFNLHRVTCAGSTR
jgi:hypothetical protein